MHRSKGRVGSELSPCVPLSFTQICANQTFVVADENVAVRVGGMGPADSVAAAELVFGRLDKVGSTDFCESFW